MIDRSSFFVRGCLEIPVRDAAEPLIWGVWVSLSEKSFIALRNVFADQYRSHVGPFFGWLNSWLKPYPDTMDLKTRVHLRDHRIRPWIELEPTDHPLAVEQRVGISVDRVAEIVLGSVWPLSSRAVVDWLVPMRVASSAWGSPARKRALINSAEISNSGASASYSALTLELASRRALTFSNGIVV